MMPSREHIRAQIAQRLAAHHLTWDDLEREFEAVLLFGSRTSEDASPDSDWDLLCVGPLSGRRQLGDLDLVVVSREDVQSDSWLTSELASCVARRSVLLFGEAPWRSDARVTAETAARKRDRLLRLLRVLREVFDDFDVGKRERELRKMRLHLQRLEYLDKGNPVPTTPELQAAWRGDSWENLLARVRLPIEAKRDLRDLRERLDAPL
jgi:predicted nucleotidyltransferase